MAIKGVDDAYLLPCGQDAAMLWEHVAVGQLDEHELDCPHCQAAAAGFHALREATGELTEADVAPPRDLTERIMRAVRTERRRDAFLGHFFFCLAKGERLGLGEEIGHQ